MSSALPLPDMAATCVPPKAKYQEEKSPKEFARRGDKVGFQLGPFSAVVGVLGGKGPRVVACVPWYAEAGLGALAGQGDGWEWRWWRMRSIFVS